MFDSEDDKMIGWLEDQGAIVWEGLAEDGQAMFRFDLDKLQEVMPELYAEIMNDIDEDLMKLYEMGLVELEYDENLNAMFKATEAGLKLAEEMEKRDMGGGDLKNILGVISPSNLIKNVKLVKQSKYNFDKYMALVNDEQ